MPHCDSGSTDMPTEREEFEQRIRADQTRIVVERVIELLYYGCVIRRDGQISKALRREFMEVKP